MASTLLPVVTAPGRLHRRSPALRRVSSAAQKKPVAPPPPEEEPLSTLDNVLLVSGAVAAPVTLWSEYTLVSTGCGLPPGPGGTLGALEGLSYLAVVGLVAASIQRKVSTGTGLPAGPGGALGAVEGVTFLAAAAGLGAAAYIIATQGGLPSAVPDARCFG
jgi:hypothetical protein